MGINVLGGALYGQPKKAEIPAGSNLEKFEKNREKLKQVQYERSHLLHTAMYGVGTAALGLAILGAASPETAKGLLEGAGDWIQDLNIGGVFGQSVEETEAFATETAAESGVGGRTMYTGAEEGLVQEGLNKVASIFDQPVFASTEGRVLVGGGAALVATPAFMKWNQERKQQIYNKGNAQLV